jgi:hypothetical protein
MIYAAFLFTAFIALIACNSGTPPAAPAPTQAPSTSSEAPVPSNPPAASDPQQPQVQVAMASSDISVGPNRVAFGLIDSQNGPIRNADVEVSTFFLTPTGQQGQVETEGPIETQDAIFRQWPTGPGGVYTANLSFDRPGTWGLGIIARTGEETVNASLPIQVKQSSATPAIGSPAPRSDSKTAEDVESLEQLTTDAEPDPELYDMSIAEAIEAGKPLMISFSTPAFCQTATCGPQLEVVKQIKEDYQGRANFIHVEVYDNPAQIQGDPSNAVISPTLQEWGLPSEPWTFIVDGNGVVQAKFESFTTREELEAALVEVL